MEAYHRAACRSRYSFDAPIAGGVWIGLVLVAHILVQHLVDEGRNIYIAFAPLDASLDWRPGPQLIFSVLVGAWTLRYAPRLANTAPWRVVLIGSAALGAVWAVALAFLDGTKGLVGSITLSGEYFSDLARVHSPIGFLHGFVSHIARYHVHVQGHPPGFLLLLWGLDQLGVARPAVIAAIEIGVGALAIPAVLWAVRDVANESTARAAAPFVAVAPLAIWIATSTDAFYTGVSAWAVALVVVATGRTDRRGDMLAVVGGTLFGITAFLSYGLVLLTLIPIAIAWRRRRIRPLLAAALGAIPIFVAFAAAGFWWFDGLAATRVRYFAGVGARRPYAQFLVANIACLAIILGPALAVALARLRRGALWTLVAGTLVAVTVADLSGMSKGEVERIWLPFAIWVLPAAAALTVEHAASHHRPNTGRSNLATPWLALQVTFTIFLQTLIHSQW